MPTASTAGHPFVSADIRRILVIKLRAVGDVVLSTIVLNNIRRAFPSARIDVLTETASADIVRTHPAVSSTLIYDRETMSGWDLIRLVRKSRYDAVFDLFGNPRTALVTRLSGARFRVGYRFRGRTYAYTHVIEPRGGAVHNTQFNLDSLEGVGIPVEDRTIHLYPSDDDRRMAAQFLEAAGLAGRTLVGVNTGGGWYTKRWSLTNFAALADRIVTEYGWSVVLPWGPGQEAEVREVRDRMMQPAYIPPATTLMQLAALFEQCAWVVTNDSGPMHIAAASGSRVLGIFGPTRPELQGPYGSSHATIRREGLECLGCNLTKCTIGNLCMTELTVDTVFSAFRQMVDSPQQLAAPR
jgi:ADP-heptose:LPS heptosyltransferase